MAPKSRSPSNAFCRLLKAPVEWIERQAGIAALEAHGEVLPKETVELIRRTGVALKGPCTTPVGEGFTSVNVQLRKRLNLYAAVRPVRNLEGVQTRFDNVDLIIIRENTEGLYSGVENQVTDDVVMSMKVATQTACLRIARWAFRFATRRKLPKITVFHKANIMKLTDGLFLKCARQIHEQEYPNIDYQELIVDAGCMRLVQDPTKFDILLLENLYGDVVSDLCAGLVGGLGVVPGANYGDEQGDFRGRPWLRSRHRRPRTGQSAGAADVRRHDAQSSGRTARGPAVPSGRGDHQERLQPGPQRGRSNTETWAATWERRRSPTRSSNGWARRREHHAEVGMP